MSAIISFSGVFLLAETYIGYLSDNYILCSLYLICIGAASSASYLCALDSQAYNFKSFRGMSLGLTSASLGISGLVFSQINDKFFKSNSEELEQDNSTFRFLLFFGCTTACITLFASFILGPIDHPKLPSIKQPILNKDTPNYAATTNGLYSISTCSTRHEEESSDTDVFFENDTISSSVQIEDEDEVNQSGLAVLLDPIGSSLFLSLLVILGFGYVYLTNIETLLISLSKNTMALSEIQHLRNLHISTFSVSNCMTRAVFGTLSDLLQRKTGMHRLWFVWFGALGLLLSVTPLIMTASNADDLLSYSLLIAIPYGIAFGIAPAIISEFGTKTFAKNWGWCMCAPAIGSQLFNLLFGFVYAKELKRQGGEICYGIDCFKTTFVIGAVSACDY
ncbi:hypothetical protein G6F43_003642 [Rhizopus delemar]|nr:hypothetical protein G6F43_003642 [Rhizopus delemar]